MTFTQLETIAIGLFGHQWQAQLAARLGVPRHTVQNWKRDNRPAAWVPPELLKLAEQRVVEVEAAYRAAGGVK